MLRELAEDLVTRGHRVTVLAPWPRYHLSEQARERQFEPVMEENGVRVIRIRTLPAHGIAYLLRGIAHLDLPRRYLHAYREHVHERVDAVVSYISPLPLAVAGAAIARANGCRHLLNVQDIFPQNAIDLGIMRNRALVAYFERMERQAYASADAITTHTEGSRRFLVERKGIPEAKVTVVPNWIDLDAWDAVRPDGRFRRRYGLDGKFIIGFPGILGPAQSLDTVLDLAKRVADLRDVVFRLVGDGTEKARVQQRARAENITNIQFEDFVDPSEYPALVKEFDVGLLCLRATYTTSMVPGKCMGFLAAGIPVLALLNAGNDGFDIIRNARCGYACQSDDLDAAEQLVRKLYAERAKLPVLGTAGRGYAAQHYAKRGCIDQLERLLVKAPMSVVST
ncbi:glycosyltransferase family 4 protein [Candidatus Uhrbacteria bacterium]|nr:glycosyltransferase family 4 protein [Candidatus Uhrbacteria bacterium]